MMETQNVLPNSPHPNYTYLNLGLPSQGRLGNQLWQIAWQIGQATAHGGSFTVRSDWEYRPFFSLPEEAYLERPDQENIDGGSFWYQELYHWDHCRDLVKQYFSPSDYAMKQLLAYLDFLPEGEFWLNRPICGLHFRRGDYLNNKDSFPIPSLNYYRHAVTKVIDDEEVNNFLVFTDDYNWVHRTLSTDKSILGELFRDGCLIVVKGTPREIPLERRIGEPKDILDLFAFAMCDEHIIANSSFSWWGAFLSDTQRAYYPSRWWGPNMSRIKDSRGVPITTSYREAILPEWIEVPSA